jgi:Isochorismatase family
MTTLANRPNTAVLVIDVQNDVMARVHNRDGVIANIGTLMDKARAEDVPVIWVRHFDQDLPKDSEEWQCVSELVRRESEPLVHKSWADAFEDSDPEARLAERGVGRLFVTGATTDVCIRSTLHGDRPRLRRDPGRRRTYHRGPHRRGRADPGSGDRAHESVLEVPPRARTPGRDRRDGRGQLHRTLSVAEIKAGRRPRSARRCARLAGRLTDSLKITLTAFWPHKDAQRCCLLRTSEYHFRGSAVE